jgi:hypothetical protein
MRALSVIDDRTIADHVLYGYLCIMQSLLSIYEHFVSQMMPYELIHTFVKFINHRYRDIIGKVYMIMVQLCIRLDYRETFLSHLSEMISTVWRMKEIKE